MKVILGTYRGPAMVNRAITSLNENLRGCDELTIIDDSGREDWVDLYRAAALQAPVPTKVLTLPHLGYNAAMKAVCAEAGNERFLFWEEDFVLQRPVDLDQIEQVLEAFPNLAQLTLQRQPWFAIERATGGMIEGLVARLGMQNVDLQKCGYRFAAYEGEPRLLWSELWFYSQVGTFSGNPAVWQTGVAADGWPDGQWSEDRKRDELCERGYRFGITEEQFVLHDGVRTGHGY